jgi:S-DNA-T family DNA segregation ATPase FtsK/SpoIIIE
MHVNWFKKLFAQLSDEEERTIEQDYAKKPEEKQKQLKAKVAYQYPAGKFRFPLIPDGGKAESLKRENREKREGKSQPVQQKRTVKPKPEHAKKETPVPEKALEQKETPKPKPKKAEKKFEKVTNTNKQPFHPTEVVSPIYGYKPRPPSKKREDYIPEIELLSHKQSSTQEIKEKNPLEDFSVLPINNNYSDAEKIQKFSDRLLDENIEAEVGITEADEAEAGFEQPVLEDSEADQTSEAETEVVEVMEEPAAALEAETVEESNNNLVVFNEQSSSIEETAVKEERQQIPKPEPVKNKDTGRQQHIPFNVIMLKQDKRSLERKKQTETHFQENLPYYQKPPITLLSIPHQHSLDDQEWVAGQKQLLDETLHHFRVGAKVVKATQGPSVTQFEVQPDPGVKVNKITNLSDDIKLSLSARDIRIEAPIPGKNTIGIEVPNRVSKPVFIREIIRHPSFIQHSSPLTVALGLDISGQPIVLDLQKMPHGLIAGATGSGKSVCVNSIIVSLLYKSTPDEVKLLLIDPKMVELTPYNHIPHLVSPVITDVKAATAALKWAVEEMDRRYELFVHAGVRDIGKYNELAKRHKQETLPYMVIIIDELADLMMVAPSDVEDSICRIAQKARACGMHLLIATQRPSVDVITGLIKANIPTRIAFSVSSQVDSRTIIDIGGAERLLGKGDMLLLENGAPKPIRVQGNFVSDEEIERAVSHVRKEQKPNYLFEQSELLKESLIQDEDELFQEACQFVVEQNGASTSSLQRRFRIGYNRAARLMEMMEDHGVISGPKGSKPRDVLVSEEELVSMQDSDY